MNKIIITGRLTKEPEAGTSANGKAFCRFGIACKRKYKNANGETETDFFNVVAFGANATYMTNYATKGILALVSGEMQMQTYSDQQGQKRTSYTITADQCEILEKREQQQAQAPQAPQVPNYYQPAPVPQPQFQPSPQSVPQPTAPSMNLPTPQPQPTGFEATDETALPFEF